RRKRLNVASAEGSGDDLTGFFCFRFWYQYFYTGGIPQMRCADGTQHGEDSAVPQQPLQHLGDGSIGGDVHHFPHGQRSSFTHSDSATPRFVNTLAFPLILIAEVCSVNWARRISPLSNFSVW